MTLEEIEQVEKRLTIQLTNTYKEFQLNYPAELIELNLHEEYFIHNSDYLIEINEMLRSGGLPHDYLVIGNDMAGNYYFMNINDLEPLVYYMDHDANYDTDGDDFSSWEEVIEKYFTVEFEDLQQFSKWLVYFYSRQR
ncbi:SMI1/KNR4 family protein [Cytophagaceae bacterium BD1B2-1]|uniref:SMI1/KNR4 family protein n=1 Tax=Xanthocytophaga agilis TaxID=3048010 RepID=A0AAE3R8H9_9BACT|nr:SMI1/KNR4 family protein [Xanthocytophaga agilis]